jgi:hypothetical protein
MANKQKAFYTQPEARGIVDGLYIRFSLIVDTPSTSKATILSLLSDTQDVIDNTNVPNYDYERSILSKIVITLTNDLNTTNDNQPREDVHYMSPKDSLPVIAFDYYGDVNNTVLIQFQNRVYNSAEARKRKILRVITNDQS